MLLDPPHTLSARLCTAAKYCFSVSFLSTTYTMPTELPYAADAEVSLSYDELEVCLDPILPDGHR